MVNTDMIPDYNENDFCSYYRKVKNDFKKIKKEFPLLKITSLPTVKPKEIYMHGLLISNKVLNLCKREIDVKRNSIEILAIYPSDYPKSEIVVEDLMKKISWDKIPKAHQHINFYRNGREVLCTHHPNGEINEFPIEVRSVAVLKSAWNIYFQYKEYLKKRVWTLKDLPHGTKGDEQLIKERKYFEK